MALILLGCLSVFLWWCMFIASSRKCDEFWAVKEDMYFQTFRRRACFLVVCPSPSCASWEKPCWLQTATIRNCGVIATLYWFSRLGRRDHIRGLHLGHSSALCGCNNLVKKQTDLFRWHVYFLWEFPPISDLRLWVLFTRSPPLVPVREGDISPGSPEPC